MNEMPNCPTVNCQCFPSALQSQECLCGLSERALRAWMAWSGGLTIPMTTEQRDWCLKEIDNVEGYCRQDYELSSDAQLARAVLDAWRDYGRDKGLI